MSGHYRRVIFEFIILDPELTRGAVGSPEAAGKPGEVTEWPIVPVSKTGEPARVPRVQIPPSPLGFSVFLAGVIVASRGASDRMLLLFTIHGMV